jgi:hypothetical protein
MIDADHYGVVRIIIIIIIIIIIEFKLKLKTIKTIIRPGNNLIICQAF